MNPVSMAGAAVLLCLAFFVGDALAALWRGVENLVDNYEGDDE